MKGFILSVFCVAFFAFSSQAQEVQITDGAILSVDKDVHDYGDIEKGADPYCEFVLTNKGNEPLIVSNAKGSCGCTVPEWSKEPILPGESSIMKVKYDTKRVGPINKSVTITSNSADNPTKVIRIKGKVLAPEEGATAPVKEVSPGAPVNE